MTLGGKEGSPPFGWGDPTCEVRKGARVEGLLDEVGMSDRERRMMPRGTWVPMREKGEVVPVPERTTMEGRMVDPRELDGRMEQGKGIRT